MKPKLIIYALVVFLIGVSRVWAEPDPPITNEIIPVTPDNFVRAETDLYFGKTVKDGTLGDFDHNRELTPIDKQTVVRMNRDTLYSAAVFDLNAGVVTITLPDPGERFMSMAMINQDHY